MMLQPIGEYILLEPITDSSKIGSLYIPESYSATIRRAIVRGVGNGKAQGGIRLIPSVAVGDLVAHGNTGVPITVDGVEMLLVSEAVIYGVERSAEVSF